MDNYRMDNTFNGGNNHGYEDDDFFDEDYLDEDNSSDGTDEDAFEEDFFGGARKKKSSSASKSKSPKNDDDKTKHSFSVVHVDIGSFEGGHFVSSTATNAGKKAATAIFRHIDIESGVAKPPKNAKGETKSVSVNSQLKAKYGKSPIASARNPIHFVILRKERKSLPKNYAYTAVRIKLSNPVETKKTGTRPAIKYEYKIQLKKVELPEKYKRENEDYKKEYNAAKRAKKAAVEKKAAPKKAAPKKAAPKRAASPKPKKAAPKRAASPKPKKAGPKKVGLNEVTLNDVIRSLTNTAPKPKKVAPKKAAPKRSASPKPKKAAAPKKTAAKKAMKGGSGFCSFF